MAVAALTSAPAFAVPYQPDANGQVVMEAEHFDFNNSASGRDWVADLTAGYVGDSAMQPVPDSFFKVTTNLNANSPRLDFEVEYSSPVTVNVWIRGLGLSGSRDSVWVGVDGDESSAFVISVARDDWGWTTAAAQLTIPAGTHTINVWMREDGTIVDRVLITPLATVPSGNGPPESLRGGGGNTAPIAIDDSFTVDEDTSANELAVLADNGDGADFDPDADAILVSAADNPGSAGGAVSINGTADGLLYSPAADFIGAETFDYTISDGNGGFGTATVTVTVNNSDNDPPGLTPVGNRSATEGQALNFAVTATDVDGLPAPAISADLGSLSGTPSFTDNGNGTASFSWTPAEGDAPGPYSVTFTAIDAVDAALTSTETISIDVQAAGGGGSGGYQPDADGQVVIEVEHFDSNTAAGNRDWVEDFTSGYVGDSAMQSVPNTFLKVSSNLNANSPRMDYDVEYPSQTTLNVWIRGLGLSGSRDSIWVGVDGDESTALVISATRSDWGWETAAGQLTVPAGTHTINIWMREDGTIVDRLLLTPLSTVPSGDGPPESSRGGTPGNTNPVAQDDSMTVNEDSSNNALAVLADNGAGPDFDPDGDGLTITFADSTGSAGGTVSINGSANGLVYTPVADYAGQETFGYTVSDGRGGSASATVTVTVNNTNNDPPVLVTIGNRSVTEQQPLAFTVTATDVDGAPWPIMTADVSQLPGAPSYVDNNNGTGSFSWTPGAGDAPGPYSVSFTATDAVNGALTATETISIDVQPAGGGGGTGAYQPDGSGQVVMEVENFDSNAGAGGRDWVDDFTAGYVGDSAMQSVPNSFLKVSTNLNANSPRMDYQVEYASSTTLNIWVRGLGLSGSRDSIWVGVDGDESTAEVVSLTRSAWGWATASGQLTVPAGVHTINIWMREDGSIVDRLLLTPLSTVPSGDGPPESPRSGGGGATLPLSDDFADGDASGWTIVDDAIQFPSNWSVVNQAFVQSEHTNSSGKDVIETYHRGSFALWTESAGLTDYRLTVDVTPDAESEDDIGVMFRYVDSNNYYRFTLNLLNGFGRLEQNLNGTFITLASDHRGYMPGALHTITVEVEGPLMQVFVNGDALFAATNGDHESGGIALFSRDNSTFDNVLLEDNATTPEIVIAQPVAHNVLPGAPLDLAVAAVARNAPASNASVQFQYHSGGAPALCNAATESSPGYFTAQCPGVPAGDYTVEALLLDSGAEIDRDSNVAVAIGSVALGSHRYDAIGNSITRGVGDSFRFDTLNLDDQRTLSSTGWPSLLGDLLTTSTGVPNLVGNEGISGDRANETRDERLFSIIERNPESDRALVMIGTNDSNNFNTTSTADLTAAIQTIIDTLRAHGRDTVYLALLPPAWGQNSTSTFYPDPLDASATRNQTVITYNTAIQALLPQAGVLQGPDFFSCFLTESVNRFSLFEDNLHPNALGYRVMAALWEDAITSGPVVPPVDPCPLPVYILESLDPYTHGHKQNLVEAGDEYYTDSAFVLTNVPPELQDGIWVMQANADNANADADFLSFDAGAVPVTVYIAYDPAGVPPTSSTHTFAPATLSENLTVSDGSVGTFSIVEATSVTGTVTIGGNKSGGAAAAQQGYVVIVVQ